MYYSIISISTYSWHAAVFYLHNQDSYFFWHFWKMIEWRNIELELKFGIMLPFPLFSCQGGNVRNRKLNGPQVMVSSYLADTEVYLVGSWKNGAGVYGFHTLGNYLVICTLPPVPSIPRSKTQQKQDDKNCPCTPPMFPEVGVLHALSWGECKHQQRLAMKLYLMLILGLLVWNQKPLHNVKYYHHFTKKEVDCGVKWLSL